MIEQVLGFSLTLWLGTYLISRDLHSQRLCFAGASFITYALNIALNLFSAYMVGIAASPLLALLAAVLWTIAALYFLRGEAPLKTWQQVLLFLAVPLFLLQGVLPTIVVSLLLCIPGIMAAAVDAAERGEGLLIDILRSFDFAAFMSLVFGGQVALVMSIIGVSLPMLGLLLGMIVTSILVQAFSDQAQTLIERIAFFRWARLRNARADLRAVANALPRTTDMLSLDQLSDDEFARHTRRALSHFGDLPRLASNPLIYLPAIDTRLVQRHAPDNTLERAVELKTLLAESVARLKPRNKGDFGTTNEWRHYNALYYPYVVGLKPYSVRAANDDVEDELSEVLRWFNASVPERTLYNWQTAATKLVAQDLRERQREAESA